MPLAAHFAGMGHAVVGVDINEVTVQAVNRGASPHSGEAGLEPLVAETVASGALSATTDFESAIPPADVILVTVPLVVDGSGRPDFSVMDAASESIGAHLSTETLVIYETTLPIGTTRTRWKPLLEQKSGLIEGLDFHVVFSPERVLTGRVFEDLKKYPKLIGGLTVEGSNRAKDFYNSVIIFDKFTAAGGENGVWDLGTAEAAEMAKLAETTYRDVNIALANQFALHADEIGVNVHSVIAACNSQPYSHIHEPGISVGGHCIPVYPQLYRSTDSRAGVVQAARDLNAEMPSLLVSRLKELVGSLDGVRVLVLGISYRPAVKEDAFSGVYALNTELSLLNAQVEVLDPLYSSEEIEFLGLKPCEDLSHVEAIMLHTSHDEFKQYSIDDFPLLRFVIDGRNFLTPSDWRGAMVSTLGNSDRIWT